MNGRKKLLFSLKHEIAQKRFVSIGVKKCWTKYDGDASKDAYKNVTGDESWIYAYEPKTKQQSTVPTVRRGKSNESCSCKKYFETDVSSAKQVMWRLFHLSIVGRSILSGTPQFVCLKSEQEKNE